MTEMSDTQARAWLDKAETLREALPFMRRYTGKTIRGEVRRPRHGATRR